MQNFTKCIYIEQGFDPEFVFNRIFTVDGSRYYVSVKDKNRISHFFMMEERLGIWKISDNREVVPWIKENESKLAEVILEKIFPEK